MKRKIDEMLLKWKNNGEKKPLMIYGNKQVGKTYSVLKFGEENYKNIAYFNTNNNIELYKILKKERTIDRIIMNLSVLSNETILEGDTLIVFDNLSDPEISNAIRVFGRNRHNYHVILISSLKENLKQMKCEEFQYRMICPMDFEEYLIAIGNEQLIDFIKNSFKNNKSMPFHTLAMEYFEDYLMTGGMPEVVYTSLNEKNSVFLNPIYDKIVDTYKKEISTLDNLIDITRSIEVFDSMSFQLQKTNKKFQYGLIKTGGRSKDYEKSIDFLCSNGFAYKSNRITEVKYPLSACKDQDNFKLYFNDTGLLFNRMYLNRTKFLSDISIKNTILENLIAITIANLGFNLYYYQSEGKAEVSFVVQTRLGKVMPIEVVNKNLSKAKSLTLFMNKFNVKEAIRVSDDNFSMKKGIKYIPGYALFCLGDIL